MNQTFWMPEKDKAVWEDHYRKLVSLMLFRDPDEAKKLPNPKWDVKWAWVEINGKKELIGVNNKTMVGYETLEYEFQHDKIQPYDRFVRWATTFDL